VRGPADFVELARSAELVLERHQIDGAVALGEPDHLLEDAAVSVPEEVSRVDHLRREIECVVVKKDGAEHRSLRLQIVRKRAFRDGGVWHWTEVRSLLPFGHHFYFDRGHDVTVELQRKIVFAKLFDWLGQLQFPSIDLKRLRRER